MARLRISTSFQHVSLNDQKAGNRDGPSVIHRGQLIFRDSYLQCIPREPVDDVAANWILFSWYTDNSSLPKDKRKMQKDKAA